MTAEFKRLGKDRAYRLGRLATQGLPQLQRPPQFQPQFVRADHRWPTGAWLTGLLAGVVLIIAGAGIGWWFMPFVVGLLAGVANWIGAWPARVALPAVALVGAIGWAEPLAVAVLRGQWHGWAVRITAGQAGLPATTAAGVLLTITVAVAQAVVGYWLGRAITPRPGRDLTAEPRAVQRGGRAGVGRCVTEPAPLPPRGAGCRCRGRRCCP